jgi:hypothetical protein
MADNTDEEHLDNPTKNQSENSLDEITPTADTETINPNQETENMEVHHHAHHEGKKNWKSYLWEFLMLFLAVFCGFLAEYQLEHVIENKREKQYIASMIEDAKTDTTNIEIAIKENNVRISHLDSLANICINYDNIKIQEIEYYKHYRRGLVRPSFVNLTERTIFQLKNAGGMRLLRNKTAVDSIILYDGMTKKLLDQQAYYELYQNNSINHAVKLFNFQKFGFGVSGQRLKDPAKMLEYFKLISTDKIKLIEFGNIILIYEGVVLQYNILLKEAKKHATNLIKTLKKEYHLP